MVLVLQILLLVQLVLGLQEKTRGQVLQESGRDRFLLKDGGQLLLCQLQKLLDIIIILRGKILVFPLLKTQTNFVGKQCRLFSCYLVIALLKNLFSIHHKCVLLLDKDLLFMQVEHCH